MLITVQTIFPSGLRQRPRIHLKKAHHIPYAGTPHSLLHKSRDSGTNIAIAEPLRQWVEVES